MGETNELLSTADVAEKLGVSARQVRRLIESGSLPAVKLGRDLFVKPEDLAAFKPRKRGRQPKEQATPPASSKQKKSKK